MAVVPNLVGMSVKDAIVVCAPDLVLTICDDGAPLATCQAPTPDDEDRIVQQHHPNTPPGAMLPVGSAVGIILQP